MEDREHESGSNRKCNIFSLLLLIVLLALVIATLVYSVRTNYIATGDRKETVTDKFASHVLTTTNDHSLPSRYVVNESFLLPPTNQASRGTCWIFATLFILESQYRNQGITQGFLDEKEYVFFSKQAYGSLVGEDCKKDPSVPACHHGGLARNSTNDHKIDSLFYFARAFPNFTASVLPENICPYYTEENPDTDFKCDGMDAAIPKNPIQFTIKSIKTASDVYSSKKLLVDAQRPLGISAPLAYLLYYGLCSKAKNQTACEAKNIKCPAGYPEEFCFLLKVEGRAPDGSFLITSDYDKVERLGGHAMNVVGYNDELQGFILHNSWREQGHSVPYLMGLRSEENEAIVCPNHRISHNWIPATLDCIKENKGDVTKCTSKPRIRGEKLANYADLLKCKKEEFCDLEAKYVLASSPKDTETPLVFKLANGMDRVSFIKWTDDDYAQIEQENYPFDYMHEIFEPVNPVNNSWDDCGYYLYPYEEVVMEKKKTSSLIDTYHVTDIEVEFDRRSFLRSQNNDFNYTLLNESMKLFETKRFDGTLPYKYVY